MAVMGKIEQLTVQAQKSGVENYAENKKPISFGEVYGSAMLKFEIDGTDKTFDEVNELIEKICSAHEQKRCLSIKIEM